MREQDGRVKEGIEWESNERNILIKEAIMGRNLVLEKFQGIHKDDPS